VNMSDSNEIAKRQSVEEICALRDAALALYAEAWGHMEAADAAIKRAHATAAAALPGQSGHGSSTYFLRETIDKFYDAVKLPERDFWFATARRVTDVRIWSRLVQVTGIEMLMDVEAKKKFHDSLCEVPARDRRTNQLARPEDVNIVTDVTPENVRATIETLRGDQDVIFARGVANAFSKLDRRFKSHDGFKIGSRIILDMAFDGFGSWRYDRWMRDTIIDIERVFAVLEGKPIGYSYASIIQAVDNDRRGRGLSPAQSETVGEFFKVRVFKNGNAHLWFTRDDLLERVNKILASYYGEVIGDGRTAEADPFGNVKTTPAKRFGFYPTPDKLADDVIEQAYLRGSRSDDTAPRVLEPSAGTGNLALPAARQGARVTCVEVQPSLAQLLSATGRFERVYNMDFLALRPELTGLFDTVVMNPPFDLERDIDHVMHAMRFLKPGGRLVSIMAAGVTVRGTRKAEAFRALVKNLGGNFRDLPGGLFASVGTNVNTVMLTLTTRAQQKEAA